MRHGVRRLLRGPILFASDELVGERTAIDLGTYGCAVHNHVVPLVGDYIRLHIITADEEGPFNVQVAKVRWAERQRFGVEFLSFSDGQAVTVRRLFQCRPLV